MQSVNVSLLIRCRHCLVVLPVAVTVSGVVAAAGCRRRRCCYCPHRCCRRLCAAARSYQHYQCRWFRSAEAQQVGKTSVRGASFVQHERMAEAELRTASNLAPTRSTYRLAWAVQQLLSGGAVRAAEAMTNLEVWGP